MEYCARSVLPRRTSGQYSPVRPSRSVSKTLIFLIINLNSFTGIAEKWMQVLAQWFYVRVLSSGWNRSSWIKSNLTMGEAVWHINIFRVLYFCLLTIFFLKKGCFSFALVYFFACRKKKDVVINQGNIFGRTHQSRLKAITRNWLVARGNGCDLRLFLLLFFSFRFVSFYSGAPAAIGAAKRSPILI